MGFAIVLYLTYLAGTQEPPQVATLAKTQHEEKDWLMLGNRRLSLVFEDDFEQETDRWEVTDEAAWRFNKQNGNSVFGLNRRKSDYQPPVRSPHNIALIKDLEVDSFVVTFDVRSTKDTGNHRDCCVFFGYQNAKQFYYVHLGAKPDPHSGQIMIVDKKPRVALTKNEKPVPWTGGWHKVKVQKNEAGEIEVFFDDMKTPLMKSKTRFSEKEELASARLMT